jgi:hypothetical protein
VTEGRLHQPPERVRTETNSQPENDHTAEALLGDRMQRSFAVGRLPAVAECELDREHADQPERHSLSDEAEAREPFDPGTVRHSLRVDSHGRLVRAP